MLSQDYSDKLLDFCVDNNSLNLNTQSELTVYLAPREVFLTSYCAVAVRHADRRRRRHARYLSSVVRRRAATATIRNYHSAGGKKCAVIMQRSTRLHNGDSILFSPPLFMQGMYPIESGIYALPMNAPAFRCHAPLIS